MSQTLYALYIYGDEHKPKDSRDLVGIFDAVKIHGVIRECGEQLGLDKGYPWQADPVRYNSYMRLGMVEDYQLNEIALLTIREAKQHSDPWNW